MSENFINMDATVKAAENGDAEAQFLLGYAYRWGNGVKREWSRAAIYLHKAMEQGHSAAKEALKELLNQTWETSERMIYESFVENL